MRYALFVFEAPGALDVLDEHEKQQVYDDFVGVSATPGIVGHRLQPPETAITLRIEAGERQTAAGPHADPERRLIGFYLLRADDVDGALEVAARIPTARLGGAVQVQPLVEEP